MPPNVLLIVLDSVRMKNTSVSGYDRATTPFLDSFADGAVTYTEARAPGMTSLPSHVSMFTGYHVEEHGVHDSLLHTTDPGITIWDELRDEGYATGVFSYNVNLVDESSSLRRSFDTVYSSGKGLFPESPGVSDFRSEYEYDSADTQVSLRYLEWASHQVTPLRAIANGAAPKLKRVVPSSRLQRALDRSGDRYVSSFLDWFRNRDGPWAACLNLMDAHNPYYPQPRFDEWGGNGLQRKQARLDPHPWKVHGGQVHWEDWAELENLYDGTIRQLDAHVERAIGALERAGQLDDTLVVITSDHGEGFGEPSRIKEHRTIGHVAGLHECLLHVPLVVSYPDQREGQEVDSLSTLTQFPAAVRASVSGEWTGDEFVPNGPVIASGSNVDRKLKNADRAAHYLDDPDRFGGIVRAVYREKGDTVRKYMTWSEEAQTVLVDGAHGSRPVPGGNARHEVNRAFDGLEDVGIRQDRRSIPDETKSRLADLGYV